MNHNNPLVWSATPTPFLENGALDERGVDRLVQQHVHLGVTGLFVGGTCGEGAFMPDRQRSEIVRLIKQYAGGSLHLAAQVSDTSAARVIENIRSMTDAGADSVVIAPPYLVADFCNRDFLRRYFLDPLDKTSCPAGIYVRSPLSKMALDLPLWDEVLGHPRVTLVKDSSGSAEFRDHFLEFKKNVRPDLMLLSGYEFDVTGWVGQGYDGCLAGTGILNGGLLRRAIESLYAGDPTSATAWQQRSNEFLYDLFRRDLSSWLAGLKYALWKMGLFTSEYSHLSFPIDDEDRRRIDVALQREKEFI